MLDFVVLEPETAVMRAIVGDASRLSRQVGKGVWDGTGFREKGVVGAEIL